MSSEVMLSYSHGASATPLLGETIGANLRRVAAAHPDAEVLVDVPASRRWTYAAFDVDTDMLARGLIAAWRGRRPGWDLGAQLRRTGAAAVRDGQGGHHPGQHQPTSSVMPCASLGCGSWSAPNASIPVTTGPRSMRSGLTWPRWRT